ncbi:MAG: MoxR family ATPase [Candidatus Brocadiae bacterium]|nr:MoxR family ATPase [Candidatus Brocadiia bacterium]
MEATDDILQAICDLKNKILGEVRKVVMGQDQTTRLCVVALFTGGHILLEGVPGTAKTLLMRTLARILNLDFKRIQFTPDLMPSDIIGTNIFNFQKNEFILSKGPIFTQFLLADEINRTPPKTQSALLQAMQENEVTIDGTTYPLSDVYMVAATQNPIEQEGTYPLPEAQLDRFLFKLIVEYPSREDEILMVQEHQHGLGQKNLDALQVRPVTNMQTICQIRKTIHRITISESIIGYIVSLVRKTRENPLLLCGGSPRSTMMLAHAAKTSAVLEGRGYVIPDDVKMVYRHILGHRILITPSAQIEGITANKILQDIVEQTPVPR